jgi:hypothetical protein
VAIQHPPFHPCHWRWGPGQGVAVEQGALAEVGMEFHGLDSDQPGDSGAGGSHWGAQGCQPCWRFWAQSLIACSRVSSLRFYRCAEGCA